MIDHVSVGVTDLERAARFYEAALAALGLTRLVTRPGTVGFGKAYPEFWINLRGGMGKVPHESGTHICLRAKTTAEVDAFHAAALSNGGTSDGAPGLRPAADTMTLVRSTERSCARSRLDSPTNSSALMPVVKRRLFSAAPPNRTSFR